MARTYLRGSLAVVQLAISLTLLIGAFLLVGTLRNLRGVDVGFDPRRLTAFTIDVRRTGYSPEAGAAALTEIETRLRGTPGVEHVANAMYSPFFRVSFIDRVQRAGVAGAAPIQVTSNQVSASYFDVLDIPIRAGRTFGDAEEAAVRAAGPQSRDELPVVINELLANQLFGNGNAAVGQTFDGVSRSGAAVRPYRVIGVAKDTRWMGLADIVGPFVYRPMGSLGIGLGSLFLVRSSLPAAELNRTIRGVLRAVGPTLIPTTLTSLTEKLEDGIAEQRVFGKVLVALSLLAVLLAGVGLYGLVSFSVTERTREFGIRLALGAEAARLVRMVLRQGAVLAVVGVPLGLVGAWGLSRLIANRLFGVSPVEPFLYFGAALLLVGIALAACLMPAKAASRVDPMIALRSE